MLIPPEHLKKILRAEEISADNKMVVVKSQIEGYSQFVDNLKKVETLLKENKVNQK